MTDKSITTLTIPDPGPRRYWNGVHAPLTDKTPLIIELRERTNSGTEVVPSFSRLIGRAKTIADPIDIERTMREILVRTARVDEFVGIIAKG